MKKYFIALFIPIFGFCEETLPEMTELTQNPTVMDGLFKENSKDFIALGVSASKISRRIEIDTLDALSIAWSHRSGAGKFRVDRQVGGSINRSNESIEQRRGVDFAAYVQCSGLAFPWKVVDLYAGPGLSLGIYHKSETADRQSETFLGLDLPIIIGYSFDNDHKTQFVQAQFNPAEKRTMVVYGRSF